MSNKFLLAIGVLVLLNASIFATDSVWNDCKDGTTSDGNYFYITGATVNSVGIRSNYVFTSITKGNCSHLFYSDATDLPMYSTLLAAVRSGKPVKVFFTSDLHDHDVTWCGETATAVLRAVDLLQQ